MAVLLSGDPVSTRSSARPWLWFNLLSVDAPLVAVTWQLWFAHCFRISLAALPIVALALTVWMIYAVDRLLDVWPPEANLATERHRFHREHAREIFIAVVLCFAALAVIACLLSPALVRDGLALSTAVVFYLALVHTFPAGAASLCPKELAVGIVFASGVSLAPWSQLGQPRVLLTPAIFFALLCFLNCSAIEVWEWKRFGELYARRPHQVTLFLVGHLRLLTAFVAIAALALFTFPHVHIVFAPIVLSALAFLWLDVERDLLPVDLLRVLADVPLLSPLLLLLPGPR